MKKVCNVVLVKVASDYCNYLRQYSECVRYNSHSKSSRPFVGVLIGINDCVYFALLSSPKEKYKTMKEQVDFIKIKNGELGVVNLNNMIPIVDDSLVTEIEDYKGNSDSYQILLRKQINWLDRNYFDIVVKGCRLYDMYINNSLPKNIVDRCCNFPLLEQKAKEYMNNLVKNK